MRSRLWSLASISLLALLLLALFGPFMRRVVTLVLERLPPLLLWALFVAVAIVIAARSLARGRRSAPPETEREIVYPGPVQKLLLWTRGGDRAAYARGQLARHLAQLSVEIFAHRQGLTAREIEGRLRTGGLELPSGIGSYLQAALEPTPPEPTGLLSRLQRYLRMAPPPSPLDLEPEQVVQFLENHVVLEGHLVLERQHEPQSDRES